MTAPSTGSSIYIPRYEVNNNPITSWTSNLVVLNTTPTSCVNNCSASFHAIFSITDGSIASQLDTPSGGIGPMRDWVVGSLPFQNNQTPPVPDGFARVSAGHPTGGSFPVVPLAFTFQGSLSTTHDIYITHTYSPPMAPQTGSWAYLPSILKAVNGQTSAFEDNEH